MFEVGATVVSVAIRNAVPMPIAPVVLPMDAVPAPPADVVSQLDRRCGAKLDRGRLGRGRGRLCRGREGQTDRRCKDQRAHFCLRRNLKQASFGDRG